LLHRAQSKIREVAKLVRDDRTAITEAIELRIRDCNGLGEGLPKGCRVVCRILDWHFYYGVHLIEHVHESAVLTD
jgi:hypothetical protein